MKRLNVVIINYRTPELAVDALASLDGELDPARDVATVVDNASGDGSAARIAEAIAARGFGDWATLLASDDNGGFSAGNNLGIGQVDAEYHLLLNSDAYVRPGAVAALLDAAERHPGAGILSPRLEWPDGTPQQSCFRYRSPVSELIEAAGSGPVTRLLARWDVPLPVRDEAFEPEWTSFACVLVRGALVDAIGPMDADYFMYFDDIDYCRRAWNGGWRVLHWPEARVVHLRGGTSPLKKQAAERRRLPGYYYHSRARYFATFYGRAGLLAANLLWWTGHGIARIREVLRTKQPHASERAGLDVWRHALDPFGPPPRP